ncbi:hypothetical protein J8273_5376 [Carpediemonas membranifera]|uniref:Uncharacterized protein n=1 Tax=Carpediemonas membranifera TaxID=201153 RepID=A0A8J6ARF2_9EUKA|nr:hypothetical protein J8273_5376 [Carpediemonas membranifera]|eukprot:KAG9392386.1 hypothetical protein J8273_5376 [Carpediemonas membranifera]
MKPDRASAEDLYQSSGSIDPEAQSHAVAVLWAVYGESQQSSPAKRAKRATRSTSSLLPSPPRFATPNFDDITYKSARGSPTLRTIDRMQTSSRLAYTRALRRVTLGTSVFMTAMSLVFVPLVGILVSLLFSNLVSLPLYFLGPLFSGIGVLEAAAELILWYRWRLEGAERGRVAALVLACGQVVGGGVYTVVMPVLLFGVYLISASGDTV